ncbi:MAG: hypothetical protein GXP47_10970 [Acidobacteria bacterium]|nr:hypothetical protein [Acidobacteriota bacterium]
MDLTADDVVTFCREGIAPFKIPARVRFLSRLPTTVTGKVQKFKLRHMALQELVAYEAS